MRHSEILLKIGFILLALFYINMLRINFAIQEDAKIIYEAAKKNLVSNYNQDLIISGSFLGFFNSYKLNYIIDLESYEFKYVNKDICIEIKFKEIKDKKDKKDKNIKVKDIIEQCESNNILFITN